jgi:NADH:ubiquinone reductase (H+-translocating)
MDTKYVDNLVDEVEQRKVAPATTGDAAKEAARRSDKPRVVIVGAGFGGINAAHALGDKDVDVLILDRNNYHGFWPLLYQVATAALEPESIAYPVRAIFRRFRNVDFQLADVRRIDFDSKRVYADASVYEYDYLVLAAGSTNNYFGNDAMANQTYGLKDIDEAERLRNRILYNFEEAVHERDARRRRTLMTFVIIGGGPTGTELAGAISELIQHVLRKDYPMLDVDDAKVMLVEAGDSILATFPQSLQRSAIKKLQKMGVELRLKAPVQTVSNGTLTFKDGTSLEAGTIVWAAGVRAAELSDAVQAERAKGGRVKINSTLNLAEHPEVFVVGDMAFLEGYEGKQAYPMLAPVAIQQGKWAANNILLQQRSRKMRPFRYFDKGNLATIGRSYAVMDAFGIRLSGWMAWIAWIFVHIMYLVGFRNRLIVLTDWAFNYITYDRGVRLITNKDWLIYPHGEPISRQRVNVK